MLKRWILMTTELLKRSEGAAQKRGGSSFLCTCSSASLLCHTYFHLLGLIPLFFSLSRSHTHTPSHEHTQFACLSTLCWAAEFTPPLRFLCNKSKIFSRLDTRSLRSCFHTSLSLKRTWRHVCCSSHISVLCFLFEQRTFPDTWFFLFHRDK